MMPLAAEILSAVLIGFAFASAGEWILGRRSTTLHLWFESFAVGAGAAALALFPLSRIVRGHALNVLLILLAITACISIVRHVRVRPEHNGAMRPSPRLDEVSWGFGAAVVAAALFFAVLNWRSPHLWDGFQIWASKAQMIYFQGGLAKEAIPELSYTGSKMNYPPLVSLYEALASVVLGEFDFNRLKSVFTVFYIGMLVFTYRAARSLAAGKVALGATALLALLAPVTAGFTIGGYADMPQGMYVAAVVAAALDPRPRASTFRDPLPWLIGSLSMVKDEGSILLVTACAALLIRWLFSGVRSLPAQLQAHWRETAVVLLFVIGRRAYLQWIGIPNESFAGFTMESLQRAISRLPEVAALALKYAFDVREWGLFWPAVAVSAAALLIYGSKVTRSLAAGVVLSWASYTGIFLFTLWTVAVHIDQAYDRLLQQIAPAASVLLAAACQQFGGGTAVDPVEARPRERRKTQPSEGSSRRSRRKPIRRAARMIRTASNEISRPAPNPGVR